MSGYYKLRVATEPRCSVPLWQALRAAGAPATIPELHVMSRARPQAICLRLGRWVRAGLVHDLGGRPKRFVMSDPAAQPSLPPRVGASGAVLPARTARDRMWTAMRVLRSFDLPQLMMAAQVTRRSAEDFINCLLRAGMLRRAYRGNSRRGDWSLYQLAGRRGPKTPIVSHGRRDGRRFRHVIDPNDGEIFDITPGRRAHPAATSSLSSEVNHAR